MKVSSFRIILIVTLSVWLSGCSTVSEKEESANVSDSAQQERSQRQLDMMQRQQRIMSERMDSEPEAAQAPSYDSSPAKEKAKKEAELAKLAEQAELEKSRQREQKVLAEAAKLEAERVKQAEVDRLQAEEKRQFAQARAAEEKAARELAESKRVADEKAAQLAEAEAKKSEKAQASSAPAAPMMFTRRKPVKTKAAVTGSNRDIDYSSTQVSSSEVSELGKSLTAVGAEKSGNAAGTIPAWTGGITTPPAGYTAGEHHRDPFAGDDVSFMIDTSNYKDYSDLLSVGQMAMFERYDSYRMPVYQTRRSASFPQRVYDKTIENASTGRLTSDGEGVLGVSEGFPFPIPKNGKQLIWNHKLKYKGVSALRYNNQVAPSAGGAYTVIKLREELLAPYSIEGNTLEDIDNILLYFYQQVEAPARLAGNVLLVHETMNQKEQGRQAWIYNPGQRRVRRAPNVAYDNPGTASDGLRTNDMTDMFNGAMDRYDWKITGKREIYIPYNSYKAHSDQVDYDDLVRPGHLNPDLMRYELHRVWVVEANLKSGVRHINARRTFYLDEDSYQIVLIDHYDQRGDLWRFSEAHSINYYELPTFWSTLETHHDLQTGRYITVGIDNQDPVNNYDHKSVPSNFTPAALRKRGKR